MNLDKYQEAAVHAKGRRIMVSASPGSGKSRVITERAKYLANETGVDPADILLLTFTKGAANVMKSRMGKIGRRLAFAGSFHAYLLRLVQERGRTLGWEPEWMTLLDEEEAKAEATEALQNTGLTGRDGQFKLAPRACKDLWGHYTRGYGLQDGVEYPPVLMERIERAFHYYRNRLQSENTMTFDLLVQDGMKLVLPLPKAHVLLDESQDMDAREWELVKLLDPAGIFTAGDISQSIYAWRGARPDLLLQFGKGADQFFSLPLTYRFGAPIADPANRMIANNTDRFEGIIVPASADLQSSVWTVRDCEWGTFGAMVAKEVAARGPSNVVVLGRTHDVLAMAADTLESIKVPVYRANAESDLMKTSEGRAMKGYVRLAVNPRDRRAFMALAMCEGLSMPALWDIRKKASETGCSLLQAYGKEMPKDYNEIIGKLAGKSTMYSAAAYYLRVIVERENPRDMQELALAMQLETVQDRLIANKERDAVSLVSIHGSKGMEWDCVFVIGMNSRTFPSNRSMSEGRLAEERNLAYVAITRAREALYIVHQREDLDPGQSQFLDEMGL